MTVAITSVVCAVVAILLATWLFAKPGNKPEKMQAALPRLHKWAYNRFYMDNVYQFVTHRIIFAYISRPIAWFDRHIIDGTMDMFATVTNSVAEKIKVLMILAVISSFMTKITSSYRVVKFTSVHFRCVFLAFLFLA